jgi:hypothetical protein
VVTGDFSILVSWPIVCAGCATDSANSGGGFDLDGLRARFEEVEAEFARPDLWDDRENAEKLGREKNRLDQELQFYDRLSGALEDAEVLLELAEEADDEEARLEVVAKFDSVESALEEAELRQLLGGEYDSCNAILSVNSGAGGTDACDWAEMLMRMYMRWAERKGYRVEILDVQYADEAGVRSATLEISGDYAYGYLNSEYIDWFGSHPSILRLDVTRPLPVSRRYPRSTTPSRSRSMTRTCGSTPIARAAREDSMSTRPILRFASPTCRVGSSCSAKTSAPSTRTEAPR